MLTSPRSINYSNDKELRLGSSVSSEKILNLTGCGKKVRTKEMHASTIDNAKQKAEHVSMRGNNLEDVGSSQQNGGYAITTMRADNLDDRGNRLSSYYLGMRSGRVSDQIKSKLTLVKLEKWVDEVCDAIQNGKPGESDLLNSYSKPIDEIPSSDPLFVLIDQTDLGADDYLIIDGYSHAVPSDFMHFDYDRGLKYCEDISLKMSFDSEEKRPFFLGGEGIKLQNMNCLLTDYLNQCPITVYYANGLTYTNGSLYKRFFISEKGLDLDKTKMSKNVIAITELKNVSMGEKGPQDATALSIKQNEFPDQSIFNLLDKIKNIENGLSTNCGPFIPFIPDCDLILCTDLGIEPADFIISSPTKICFVHIKCDNTNKPRSSAGALAIVGSQSMKNINQYFSSEDENLASNWTNLESDWGCNEAPGYCVGRIRLLEKKHEAGLLINSSRKALSKLKKAWEIIKERRASHAVDKEIWVVVGNSFSRKNFVTQMKKGKDANAESLQAYQLIDQWISTANGYGAEFKIFVSP